MVHEKTYIYQIVFYQLTWHWNVYISCTFYVLFDIYIDNNSVVLYCEKNKETR